MAGVEPWKVIAKSAQLRTDPQFDISNEKKSNNKSQYG